MELDKNLIDYIAKLSKIELSEDESLSIFSELSEIVNYMEILKTLDTEKVEAMSHVFSVTNVMRNDVVKESLPREDILKNAPVSNDEAFIVPKTVE